MEQKEQKFFVDDVVCSKKKRTNFGAIIKTPWDSSDDEDSSESSLEENTVEILWNDDNSSKLKCNNIVLVDRPLLHGDIVALVSDPQGQTGTVTDIILTADIKLLQSQVFLTDVAAMHLSDVHEFMVGRFVVRRESPCLIGTIEEVFYNLTVKFADGTSGKLKGVSTKEVRPASADKDDENDANFPFYPSQKVCAENYVWKKNNNFKPQTGGKKKSLTATITIVEPASIVVKWSFYTTGAPVSNKCKPSDLIVLNHYKYSKYEIGDYVMIHPSIKSLYLNKKNNPDAKNTNKIPDITLPEQIPDYLHNWLSGTETDIARVLCTHTYIRVQWQNGTISEYIPSINFVPRDHLQDFDFWPNDFVVHKESQNKGIEKIGVVLKVDSQDKTADIKWIEEGIVEEGISVYEIAENKSYDFRLGGTVYSLPKKAAGEIIQFYGTADINIAWADKSTSIEKFNSLLIIDEDDDDNRREIPEQPAPAPAPAPNNNSEERDSQVENNQKVPTQSEEKEPTIVENNNQIHEESEKIPEFITPESSNHNNHPLHEQNPFSQPTSEPENVINNSLSAEEDNHENSEKSETGQDSFVILEDITQHHFSNLPVNTKVSRIIMKEWKTLQTLLPKGIYMTTYQSRMDLLKVLVIGPENTIYYNSYYIFDISLPSDYPVSPPKVFYNSGGYRLHPNLYEDGNVCLSLLGTWAGDYAERWIPNQSNILQLVVSLQGLILGVKEPYFLEAGYDKQRGTKQGIQSSHVYNERALLLSLKHMLHVYQNTPSEFSTIIKSHFRSHIKEVLSLFHYCENILLESQQPSAEKDTKWMEIVKEKYLLPCPPSKGFLNPLIKDFKVKFEEEISKGQ